MARRKRLFAWTRRSALLATLLVISLLAVGYFMLRDDKPNNGSTDNTTTVPGYVNLEPPTEEQRNAARDETPSATPSQTGSKKAVTPIITSADSQEVRAYVPGVNEDGGTCTATFTRGQTKITASADGFSNVSYTSCKPIKVSGLTAGSWSVVVGYSSVAAEGQSQSTNVEVK